MQDQVLAGPASGVQLIAASLRPHAAFPQHPRRQKGLPSSLPATPAHWDRDPRSRLHLTRILSFQAPSPATAPQDSEPPGHAACGETVPTRQEHLLGARTSCKEEPRLLFWGELPPHSHIKVLAPDPSEYVT